MNDNRETPDAPNVPYLVDFCLGLSIFANWVERMLAAPVPVLMTDRAHANWKERKRLLRVELERLYDECTRAMNARIVEAAKHCGGN